jgi:hypothetical protein
VSDLANDTGFTCARCGERHEGLPFSYFANVPVYWRDEFATEASCMLSDELCIIKGETFFVRGRIVIPVVEALQEFEWNVWVSLSRTNFERALELWSTPGREDEPSYFGWLSSELPYEPSTLNLPTQVRTQQVGQRFLVEVEHNNHPLSVEQHHGMSLAKVREIFEQVAHPA